MGVNIMGELSKETTKSSKDMVGTTHGQAQLLRPWLLAAVTMPCHCPQSVGMGPCALVPEWARVHCPPQPLPGQGIGGFVAQGQAQQWCGWVGRAAHAWIVCFGGASSRALLAPWVAIRLLLLPGETSTGPLWLPLVWPAYLPPMSASPQTTKAMLLTKGAPTPHQLLFGLLAPTVGWPMEASL